MLKKVIIGILVLSLTAGSISYAAASEIVSGVPEETTKTESSADDKIKGEGECIVKEDETSKEEESQKENEISKEVGAEEVAEQEKTLAEVLQNPDAIFTEKLQRMSKDPNLYGSLKAMPDYSEVIRSMLVNLEIEECYQYTIFMQHQFLALITQDGNPEEEKEILNLALDILKISSNFLLQKTSTNPNVVNAEELEQTLFDDIFVDEYREAKYISGDTGEKTDIKNFFDLRLYLAEQSTKEIDVEEIYSKLGCYRGETGTENINIQQEEFTKYIESLYKKDEDIPSSDEESQTESDIDSVPEIDKPVDSGQDSQEPELNQDSKSTQETKPEDKIESKSENVQETESVVPDVAEEAGEGVLEQAASRTIDLPPEPAAISSGFRMFGLTEQEPKEEKYYEVYARATSDIVDKVQVEITIQGESNTYEAEEGDYEIDETQYNWKLKLPYNEMPLEGSDGLVSSDLIALDTKGKTVGRVVNMARLASGVYSNNKEWVGSDFSKLNTNKNPNQVYYVYGTVYSDDYNNHYIARNSIFGDNVYSILSISSYNTEKATIRLRTSGHANKGTWVAIYGRMTLSNLNIISTGNSGDLGIVSAKNPESVNSATRQSVMTVTNCSFSNGGKWAIHGDRNSYLDISGCSITNTKGGVGAHGEINVRNCSFNNIGSDYSGRAGIHLNVPISQGSFKHSMNLENNYIRGYVMGVEYAVSNLFANQQVGNTITSLSLTTTGSGNVISDCTTGLCTTKQNVSTPYTVNVQNSMQDISGYSVGIRNNDYRDTFKISGGDIHGGSNGVENAGTFVMSGGSIYSNTRGIYNAGNANVAGGEVRSNTTGIDNPGSLTVSGGRVYGNTAQGIYQNGSFSFTGGQIYNNSGCDVYLETNHVIDWTTEHQNTGVPVPRIDSRSRTLGTNLVRVTSGSGQSAEDYFDVVHGGRYTDRGGNRNGNTWGNLVLSEYYTVTYLSNSYGEVSNMPANGRKFWNESYTVPEQKPYNKTYSYVQFKGWDYNGDDVTDAFNGSILTMNQDIVMKALWKDLIIVRYFPNGGTGTKKEERVTNVGVVSTGGNYAIKKNIGFLNSARSGYTFVGFDVDSKQKPKHTAYRENTNSQISFSDLLKHAYENKNYLYVDLYAIWDKQPEIKFNGVNEFYEGTDVRSVALKSNVTVQDQEDGDITANLRIVGIKYADGKLVDGVQTAGETVKFAGDMSESDRLDTWFMALDKEKSPIEHTIVYEVTDSMGGVTRAEHGVRVKYNEFPEIITRDRYFTLEEAQSGVITEELLIKDALESGKVKVTDAEEDVRDPEYIKSQLKLVKFIPEEFTSIEYGGMITLEYCVKDTMGPEGEGKETRQKVKIYVVKQGEIPAAPVTSKVRFIDEENYRKNEGKAELNLTPEEKEELNKNGGLHVDSIWYTNPKHKALIERCFDENAEPLIVYEFSDEEVEEAKRFIEENGIGNSQDPTALSRFKEKFME